MRVGPWSRGPTEEQGEDGTTSSRVRLRGAQGVAEVIQAPVGGAWLCDGPLSSPLACRARFAGCLFAFTAALLALASAAPLPHTCSQIDSTLAGCPPAVTGLTIGHTGDSQSPNIKQSTSTHFWKQGIFFRSPPGHQWLNSYASAEFPAC